MRLVRLRIKNIASLRGEHLIDFQGILQDSSLFAITGETGAGKSTILNCVGLSLYGQIYKKNITQLDVVTLGEKDGSIELIFQSKGAYYLAEWKARIKKQNGEPYATPQPALRTLYKLQGPGFDAGRELSHENAANLLNMDFDQFCKCVILNQGEFAKFLSSSFNDRKDILEKLYPGEDLENMGRELRQELEALKQEKTETEIKLGELPTDPTTGDRLKKEKLHLEIQLKSLDSQLKFLEEIDRHFSSILTYYDKHQEGLVKKDQLSKDLTQETTRLNLLIKNGEEIFTRAEKARRTQEREFPRLQELLKKEETLKNLIEGKDRLEKTIIILNEELKTISNKKEKKQNEREETKGRLFELEKSIGLPINLLKSTRDHHSHLFDLFSEKELIEQQIQGKKEGLDQLEQSGKDLRSTYDSLQEDLSLFPQNLDNQVKSCEEKRANNSLALQKKNLAQIRSDDLLRQAEILKNEAKNNETKLFGFSSLKDELKKELFPLETTLALQEVLKATSLCVNHAISKNLSECPVCDHSINEGQLRKIQKKFEQSDLPGIQKKFESLTEKLLVANREEMMTLEKSRRDQERLLEIEAEVLKLQQDLSQETLQPNLIEEELEELKKKTWKRDALQKDLLQKKGDLEKIRVQYQTQKKELESLGKKLTDKEESLSKMSDIFRPLFSEINKDTIRELKREAATLYSYLDLESKSLLLAEELRQIEIHESKQREDHILKCSETLSLSDRIRALEEEFSRELKGEKASVIIQRLSKEMQLAQDEWLKQLELQRRQEGLLKDSLGRLGQLEELLKDFELQFLKELHSLNEIAQKLEIPGLMFMKELQLTFQSERQLYIPIKDLLTKEREDHKDRANQCRMDLATVMANLSEWEKVQDKIGLLTFKLKELSEVVHRKERLYEVLGKDELRTFVLALVEESLILQTNEELQKLCQGRYEIVHQTKSLRMTPEFYILDKYREGGRRKVSTLSGGETFMVSLAMALGLAEMTRGQAEIDSLFIDEGFGTLDQDSLEDVLNMLQQIQTRGLMVGIISHIKGLTGSIAVNLNLKKKNDGTSSIEVVHN